MLSVHPDYSGKLRVLLGNLGRGVDTDVAYNNAFQKSAEEIERDLDRYIEAGKFDTVPVSGRAISAQRQFLPKEVDETVGLVALADAAAPAAGYQAILKRNPDNAEAREGLGMIEQSMTHLADAKDARALLVRADITKDPAEKNATPRSRGQSESSMGRTTAPTGCSPDAPGAAARDAPHRSPS